MKPSKIKKNILSTTTIKIDASGSRGTGFLFGFMIDKENLAPILVCCFRNSLLFLRGFKHLTRTLNFVQNIFSLCVPNVPGRLSIA